MVVVVVKVVVVVVDVGLLQLYAGRLLFAVHRSQRAIGASYQMHLLRRLRRLRAAGAVTIIDVILRLEQLMIMLAVRGRGRMMWDCRRVQEVVVLVAPDAGGAVQQASEVIASDVLHATAAH